MNGHTLSLAACLLAVGGQAMDLGTVTVEGSPVEASPVTEMQTATTIDKQAMDLLGGQSQANAYNVVKDAPSVHSESKDSYGLDADLRVRGKNHSHHNGTGNNVEGLPLTGIGPGVKSIFDLENVRNVTLRKGSVPADKGFGFANDTGPIDLRLLRPSMQFGAYVKQGAGAFGFLRTFARVDSGDIGEDSALFFSYSNLQVEKWKGKGDTAAPRENFTLGITQDFDNGTKIELFAAKNHLDQHAFRGLTYDQSKDLDTYYRYDYETKLTGDPSNDYAYYDYNRDSADTATYLTNIEIMTGEFGQLSIKPYLTQEEGDSLASMKMGANYFVRKWHFEHDTYGFLTEYAWFGPKNSEVDIGYWYQEHETPGPPRAWKLMGTDAQGDLVFKKWLLLSESTNHRFNTPFVSAKMELDRWSFEAGTKYLMLDQPSFTYYDTKGIPDVSYDTALAMDPAVKAKVWGNRYNEWLPNASVNYRFDKDNSLSLAYGKTYYTPEYALGGMLAMKLDAILQAGVPLQGIWDRLRPEISDNIDLNLYLSGNGWHLKPTLYWNASKHKGVNVYDAALDYTFKQNIAEATAYGAELEAGMTVANGFDVSTVLAYNRAYFDDDLHTSADYYVKAKGNQLPDVPKLIGRFIGSYRNGSWGVDGILNCVGQRYGDVENKEKVSAYQTVDIMLSYTHALAPLKAVEAQLGVTNLFDSHYIGAIGSTDETTAGGTTYYAAPPLAISGSIALRY